MFNSKKDRLFCKWFKRKNLVGGSSRVGFRESYCKVGFESNKLFVLLEKFAESINK